MARDPQDREDLLRDATGLVSRVELKIPDVETKIVCGFRADGSLSIYWGQDEVVQFNALGELRRGYWQGRLLATYRRQLVWLDRSQQEGGRMRFAREPFTAEERKDFIAQLMRRIDQLQQSVSGREFQLIGQIPPDENILGRLGDWFSGRKGTIQLARQPGLGR